VVRVGTYPALICIAAALLFVARRLLMKSRLCRTGGFVATCLLAATSGCKHSIVAIQPADNSELKQTYDTDQKDREAPNQQARLVSNRAP
jgi:hypothetical protein